VRGGFRFNRDAAQEREKEREEKEKEKERKEERERDNMNGSKLLRVWKEEEAV
jgi:hypothetical protein